MKNALKKKAAEVPQKAPRLTASSFEALSDAEKDRLYSRIDAQAATMFETAKPLTAWQKKALAKARKRMGRPKVGNGAAAVTVSVEKTLLKRADAYAKAHGMKRSELFVAGVSQIIGA